MQILKLTRLIGNNGLFRAISNPNFRQLFHLPTYKFLLATSVYRFYIGCDLCSNWFHGTCVNISPEQSSAIDKYECRDCIASEEAWDRAGDDKLYCICQTPYDDNELEILLALTYFQSVVTLTYNCSDTYLLSKCTDTYLLTYNCSDIYLLSKCSDIYLLSKCSNTYLQLY